MSGEYKKGSGVIYMSKSILDKESEVILEMMFDQQTDWEEDGIKLMKKETSTYKRLSWVKLLLSPIELPLTLFIVGYEEAIIKYKITVLSIKLLRNKIDLIQFNHSLNNINL